MHAKTCIVNNLHVLLRLISLEEGEGDLPRSLILLQKCQQSGDTCVIGHVRMIAAAGRPRAALVEACKLIILLQAYIHLPLLLVTVLVTKELRGQGYGRRLMQAAEEYVAGLNYHRVHLSTHDMQSFYRHLGYEDGPPTTALRGCIARLSNEQVGKARELICWWYFSTSPQSEMLCKVSESPPAPPPPFPASTGSIVPLPPSLPPPPPPPVPDFAQQTMTMASSWLQKTL